MIMKVDLTNYQGDVAKTATIESNDPDKPLQVLKLMGFVTAIVTMKPSANVSFSGPAGRLSESVVDLEATTTPFHIKGAETNLAESVNYTIQTVADGTSYRLKIANKARKGSYSGFIRLKTDLPKTPYLLVRVMGVIKGEIAAAPETVITGRLGSGKPVRQGSVIVTSSDGEPFKISGLTYDEHLMSISRKKLENQNGYELVIRPELDGAGPGVRQAPLAIETDRGSEAKVDVLVLIFNNSGGPGTKR